MSMKSFDSNPDILRPIASVQLVDINGATCGVMVTWQNSIPWLNELAFELLGFKVIPQHPTMT